MKVNIVKRNLKEGINPKNLLEVLQLIGQAHDKIIEAQDLISDLKYQYEDDEEIEFLDVLEEILDYLESTLSEHDYMGDDDPVESFKEESGIEIL